MPARWPQKSLVIVGAVKRLIIVAVIVQYSVVFTSVVVDFRPRVQLVLDCV